MTGVQTDLILLLGGVGAILIVATLTAVILRKRFAPDGSNPVIETLMDRVEAWWMMAILMSIALLFGRIGMILLFAFCSFAALREFLTLTSKSRADHYALLASFFLVLPLQYVFIGFDNFGLFSIFIPVYAFLLLPVFSVLRRDTENFLNRVAETQWALMITVFAASHVPALLNLSIEGFEGRNILLIAYLIFVVQFSDVAQYVIGKLCGKRPLAPELSRSKTWEGTLGGIALATLVGAFLWWLTPFSFLQSALMSLIISLMGLAGFLVMSAIKRDRGVKDWGHYIQGHGGLIDRLDSVVFAAPVFFHLTRFFWG